jgi:hypothetical protein
MLFNQITGDTAASLYASQQSSRMYHIWNHSCETNPVTEPSNSDKSVQEGSKKFLQHSDRYLSDYKRCYNPEIKTKREKYVPKI